MAKLTLAVLFVISGFSIKGFAACSDLVKMCMDVGIEKAEYEARKYGCHYIPDSIYATSWLCDSTPPYRREVYYNAEIFCDETGKKRTVHETVLYSPFSTRCY